MTSLLMLIGQANGSVISPFGNTSFLGLGWGTGVTRASSRLAAPGVTTSEGEYYCRARSFAMQAGFSGLWGKDETGLHMGWCFGINLGGSFSKYYLIQTNRPNPNPEMQTSFDLLTDMWGGLQCAWYDKPSSRIIGLRYMNSYKADALRSGYGNADDAANLCLFYADHHIGANINYGSDKIPGILVKSDVWDVLQFDLRYRLNSFDDGMSSLYAGVRFEKSFMKDDQTFLNIEGIQSSKTSSWLFTIGLAGGKKKK